MGVALESGSPECFSKVMASMPGFRFHPTDEELVMYYLKRKMCQRKLKLDVIRETDVYKWDPEELPGQSGLKTGDRQWFFFSPRDRKYPNGARSNRATRHGYWKATGKDRDVKYNSRAVGLKKTLVFYRGRAPNGVRTDWVMHEYTLDEEELNRCRRVKDYYALYKVFKKSGAGPKNGEQYGAPFKEEEWADADDDIVDFNIRPADRELQTQELGGVTSIDTVTVDDQPQPQPQLQPLFDDQIEEIWKNLMDDGPVLDLQRASGHLGFPQAVAEETQSSVVDQFSQELIFPEPVRILPSSDQQYDVQPNISFNQEATSHSHVFEASEVTSAAIIEREELHFQDDFLEIDDLIGPDLRPSDIIQPVENLQFEDGLSELDLYHDAEMFLRDMGPIDQGTVSHAYMGTLHSDITSQNYQLLPNQEDGNQTGGEFRMHDQRNSLSPAEGIDGSFALPTQGVFESANLPTEGNENQNSTVGGVATSRFSSALWTLVESIPTTPASACENALVNRAFERMSSFTRMKVNIRQTNVAAGNDTATMKKAGRKGVLFLFFSILVALCAFLWVSVGRLLAS